MLDVDLTSVVQGSENEIILLSMVRCNKQRQLGFLSDQRRFNVSITRTRRLLILIGCPRTLEKNKTLGHFIDYIRQKGHIHKLDL